ncbi:carbohydrate ABC transporter permease [Bifidobacterium scardovii]|uniref:Binding-protein-dependent transport system inner membrane protein n=1 Tax=Bifidobacterium scardovii TaxID=158787 RepID=A0A087DBI4_9BIFI|nr:sugar ABC transporter permease [Bifidobacterium scardovii]KFI92884.1 binding-protein-dependent transport system inner membrane protein [Bifidobacterium scardovii]MDK6349987.1 sugar ABC transporter permease [Bifidobacterium scardovii]BAQ30439.1 putative sugar ABC transporter permease component [Bifidobacterium scardovii JCM 12489 = DSM 13734]
MTHQTVTPETKDDKPDKPGIPKISSYDPDKPYYRIDADSTVETQQRIFRWRNALTIFLFLLPAIVFVIIFTYYPVLSGANMAFRNWNLNDLTDTSWVGWHNFKDIVSDQNFGAIVRNSIIWVLASITPQLILGFLLALALWKRFRFRGVYQAFVFFPWAVSGFLIGILFRWMFNAEFGVINDLLEKAHLIHSPINWLAAPNTAMAAAIIANIWYGVTFFAIMILAALQSVPQDILEAAALDGAGRVRTVWSIVIPCISPTLTTTILLRVIWIFNFPDIIWAMTGGGPANQTHILTSWMVQVNGTGDYGHGSAIGFIVVLILTMFAMVYLPLLNKKVDE